MDSTAKADAAEPQPGTTSRLDTDLKTISRWALCAFLLGWLAILARFCTLAYGAVAPAHANDAPNGPPYIAAMFVAFVWSLAWLAGG